MISTELVEDLVCISKNLSLVRIDYLGDPHCHIYISDDVMTNDSNYIRINIDKDKAHELITLLERYVTSKGAS